MSGSAVRLLPGTRVTELTGLHGTTLGKLVQEGFLERDERTLRYRGTEAVIAQVLANLGTRASKPDAKRDRLAVNALREALNRDAVSESTGLVIAPNFARLTHTLGELLDATAHLRDYRVLGVGAWLSEFRAQEPGAFQQELIAAH
ncbi:hypothetical protein ACFY1P_20620 [Streptomyces sp. NPDC001407]|uniref:hypothetical protein n=1 Tax=Streptomyces sp. NPDC001407 TaxID=3364573 RepID=UPI0036C0F384